jgi:dTDP-4-dehydrorhamnose 3,5-epimerase
VVFRELSIHGAFVIELERVPDHRGFNARAWDAQEFEALGLSARIVQSNIIYNAAKGTLRGMHYQAAPMAESKLFRVTRGSMYDVIVDIRRGSPTFRVWTSVELDALSYRMLYVPEGVAQGFMTLEDATEVTYQVSAPFSPEHGRGFRHDDPAFGIEWPLKVQVISEKDRTWPDFEEPT